MNQPAQHAFVGESLQVGAGLTKSAPNAFHLANLEALSDKCVQVDAAGDDVASSLRIPESVAVGQGEFIEHFRASFLSGPGRSLEWTYRGLKRTIPDIAPSTEARFLLMLAIDLQEGKLPVGELSFFAEQEQLVTARAR